MNRRQQIIVSVTGIFLVLLILVGLTYGYFLTRIDGNTNDKSIGVTTALLELKYDDGTDMINASGIVPITADKIKTGAAKKTFSIAKTVKSSNVYAKFELTDIEITENLRDYDLKWALYQGNTKITTGTFIQTEGTYIKEHLYKLNNKIILANNVLVSSSDPVEYDLYVWIDETGLDQSELMNGSVSAKIQVSGTGKKVNTLASVILGDNNVNVKNEEFNFANDFTNTNTYLSSPITLRNAPIYETNYTSGLYVQQSESETNEKSEYGFPTYYFKGDVTNNYVKFGKYQTTHGGNVVGEDIIWRIVRINEDGSIKLITENNILDSYSWGYNNVNYNESEVKTVLDSWYSSNIGNIDSLDENVVTSAFCNDTTMDGERYSAKNRLYVNKEPIFTCPNGATIVNEKVGMITADELMFSGAITNPINNNVTYLSNGHYFWTMTPSGIDIYDERDAAINADSDYFNSVGNNSIYVWNPNLLLYTTRNNSASDSRAVINLYPDVVVTGGDGLSPETAYTISSGIFDNVYELTGDMTEQSEFPQAIKNLPDNSTVILKNGTFDLTFLPSYNIPKNLTITAGDGAIVNKIGIANSTNVEGLTISDIDFKGSVAIYSEGNLKNLTVSDCTFENGGGIRIGMGVNSPSPTNENTTIKNNTFSGSYKSYSHITLSYAMGTTTVEGNKIDGGRNAIQLTGTVSGTSNILNNTISNASDAAFRVAVVNDNTNINITKNTISNSITPSTGSVINIGYKSNISATSTINISNNTYDGATWPNTTWNNVEGDFGVNKAGEKVDGEPT